jgi:DNA-directed RNA polymerase subunit N (RpoN/RPB10)
MRRNSAASLTGTYVACLDCGKEFANDWNEMKVMTSSAEGRERMRALAHKAAA